MDVAQIITIILISISIILALIIVFKDDKKNSVLYSFIVIVFVTMGWMTMNNNNEMKLNENIDNEVEETEIIELSPISKKLKTGIDKNFFKVGSEFDAGRYSVMSLDATEETIFFVWNEDGDKIVSEVIGGDNGVPVYNMTFTDGMQVATWNSSGVELMTGQNVDTIIEAGIYEVGEDLTAGKYKVKNMIAEDDEGLIQVFDEASVNTITIENDESVEDIELKEGYTIKVTNKAVAKLTYLPEGQTLKLNTDNE